MSDSAKTEQTVGRFNFVPRIRGARNVFTLTAAQFAQRAQRYRVNPDVTFTTQEYMKGDTRVRPYLDWDTKYKDRSVGDTDEERQKQLDEFKAVARRLFPTARRIVYAERHGVIGDPNDPDREYQYKTSFRAWVIGVWVTVAQLAGYIRRKLGLTAKAVHPHLDLSVYKVKEQLLGVVYSCKDIDVVPRYLRPLDPTEALENFLAQNVAGEDSEEPDMPLMVALETDVNIVAAMGATEKKGKGKVPRAGKGKAVETLGDSGDSPSRPPAVDGVTGTTDILSGAKYHGVFQASTKFFGKQYRMQEKLTQAMVSREDKYLIFPTTEKWCFIKEERHAGNNPYIVVTDRGSRWKCFDEECKKVGDVKLIPLTDLPKELRDLYTETFYGAIDNGLMTEAKVECRRNITDNFPEEEVESLDVMRYSNMLTTLAKCQTCKKCKSGKMQFEHQLNGWQLTCNDCEQRWPTNPVPIGEVDFPKLCAVLTQLNIGTVNITNNNSITNIYNGLQVDFYADFSGDKLVVFEVDTNLNELFIRSLQGTDTVLSRFTTEFFKDRFHCTSQKKWYRFDGHCWSDDAAELAYKEAMSKDDFLQPFRHVALHFENLPIQNDDVKRKARMVRKLCVQLEDGKQREKIVADSIMKFHERRPKFAEELNTQNIMVFEDGVYSFDTFTFGSGHPDTAVTMRVPQPFIPYEENEDVRFLMNFMADLLPDPAVRTYTLKVLGICLTMDTSQQYFFVWTGSGGNGKGRLLALMEKCLGMYYQAVGPTFLTRKREDANQANEALMSLRSVRLAVFQEPEASDVLQASTIKNMTGEDTMSSRENYGRQVKFTPSFKSLLVCNDVPNVSESTIALWRRFRVIHFTTAFVEEPTLPHERKIDHALNEKLKQAAPYFIGILIHFFRLYKQEGLMEPRAVTAATDRYKNSVDKVKQFVDEYLCRTADPEEILPWVAVFETFKQKFGPTKRDSLRSELLKHGLVYKDSSIHNVKFTGFLGWRMSRTSA